MPDIVRVKNLGARPHRGRLNGTPYEVPAGGETILDREAAVKDFGDWTARNLGPRPKDRKRDKEYARIRGLYGVHAGTIITERGADGSPVFDEKGNPREVLADAVAGDYLPSVEIFVPDESGSVSPGVRVASIIEDTQGKSLPLDGAAAGDVAAVVESQDERIAKQERDIAELKELLLSSRGAIAAPKDEPATAKRPQAKKPEVTASQSARD